MPCRAPPLRELPRSRTWINAGRTIPLEGVVRGLGAVIHIVCLSRRSIASSAASKIRAKVTSVPLRFVPRGVRVPPRAAAPPWTSTRLERRRVTNGESAGSARRWRSRGLRNRRKHLEAYTLNVVFRLRDTARPQSRHSGTVSRRRNGPSDRALEPSVRARA
jgi:hypothetical protein